MASDLISRSKAKEEILARARGITNPKILSTEDTMTVLDMMKGVDAVEVVRCKDCVFCAVITSDPDDELCGVLGCAQYGKIVLPTFFCNWGTKKDAVD